MTTSEILEAMMLASFSVGWYWSIIYMLRKRRPYGKSGGFVCFTIVGYGMGLTAKILAWQMGMPFSYLIILYGWNLGMTALDLILVVYFTRISSFSEQANSTSSLGSARVPSPLANNEVRCLLRPVET